MAPNQEGEVMITEYIRAKHLDDSDHVFAEFLRANDWRGDTATTREAVKYIDPHGHAIAIGYYDNEKCRYKVWAHKAAKQ